MGRKGELGRKKEIHPLRSFLPERFEGLVSTWHPRCRTKRLGREERRGVSDTLGGDWGQGAAGAGATSSRSRGEPRTSPSGTGRRRCPPSGPGSGARVQGGPRSPLGARGEFGPDSPAPDADASRSSDPRSALRVRVRRGVNLPARTGSSGEAMGTGWGRRAPEPGRAAGGTGEESRVAGLGCPAFRTRGERTSAAPRAPPPPAPPLSPPLFPALTSCLAISKAPAVCVRVPPPAPRRASRSPGAAGRGAGRVPGCPGVPSYRRERRSGPAPRSPTAGPAAELARVLPGTCCEAIISLKSRLQSRVALLAPCFPPESGRNSPPRTGLGGDAWRRSDVRPFPAL